MDNKEQKPKVRRIILKERGEVLAIGYIPQDWDLHMEEAVIGADRFEFFKDEEMQFKSVIKVSPAMEIFYATRKEFELYEQRARAFLTRAKAENDFGENVLNTAINYILTTLENARKEVQKNENAVQSEVQS